MPVDVRQRRPIASTSPSLLTSSSEEEENKDHSGDHLLLNNVHWTFISISIISLILVTSHLHKCLPIPLEPNTENTRFSEVRAMPLLKELSKYGPKPAGSHQCEELTRNRILNELKSIKNNANSDVNFLIETQNPSGCFDIPKFDTDGFTICYRNVSNVIARLGSGKSEDKVAVLLNCHYDSWPVGSGGSDDLISCALMMELIRLLSTQPNKLQNDVIFLFNGAEESSLQAAHGFITKHPWRHSVRAFINLEASGSGGRELLFQAGPANQWLLNAYLEAAVHPHCSIIGQEVFQSGVYPGDTDYRVFRDYGRVPGLDLAFVQNGYWWHTEFDEMERITPGSLQRAGENVYSTLCHLLRSPFLQKPAEYGDHKSVFFDFLGLFVVVYPLSMAHLVNILLIVVIIATSIPLHTNGTLYHAIRNYVLVLIAMIVMNQIMVKLTTKLLGVLLWYSHHWVAAVVYGIPSVWIGATTQTFLTSGMNTKQKQKHANAIQQIHFLFVSVVLAVFTYFDIASGFVFTLMLLPFALKFLVNENTNPWLRIFFHFLFHLPSVAMVIYTSQMLLSIFIPIMGRTSSNPEPVVSIFVLISSMTIVLSLLPLLTTSKNVRDASEIGIGSYISLVIGIFMVVGVIFYILSTIIQSPFRYSHEYPTTKRTQFMHSNRLFMNKDGTIRLNDSVIFAISHDFRGAEDIPFVNDENDFKQLRCEYDDPYCEIPFYYPTRHRVQERHIQFKYASERPYFSRKTDISVEKREIKDNFITYHFKAEGSGQISVYLMAQESFIITNCSISTPIEEGEKNVFLFLTCSGNDCGEWRFNIQLKNTNNSSTNLPLLVGISSHYLHGPHMQSDSLKQITTTIEQQRQKDNRWAITTSGWNVDLVYKYV